MHVIIAPIQIKDGLKAAFMEEMLADARGSLAEEGGCLRFDVIQDPEDENRIWLYEIYRDAEAFQAHLETPHFTRWKTMVPDWIDSPPMEPVLGGAPLFLTENA